MTGEVAAAGDIATGTLVARTVEPHAGEGRGAADGLCLNCGTARLGPFCHACGQTAHVHRTLLSIGHDLLHGVFHFEGKIWRTLPLLAWRPGDLTRRYIAGERARFVSPMAVFLFAIFLMFAVLGSLPGWDLSRGDMFSSGSTADARFALQQQRQRAVDDLTERRGALGAQLKTPGADPARTARLRQRVERATAGLHAIDRAIAILPAPAAGSDDARVEAAPTNWVDAKWRLAKRNPELLLYKLKSEAYKYSWALIPLSLPFIWLLFPFRRDVGFYDHAIFATYSLSFMSLLVVVLAVLGAIGVADDALAFGWLLIPPWHIYRQLKGAYGLTRAGAVWRTLLMLVFALIAFVCFVLILAYLGVAD